MKVLDLFSGIGGFSLGLEWAGMETVAFCEYDEKARQVLTKHWPDVPKYTDVRTLTAEKLKNDGITDIELICGGYPCQPFSTAGKRAGAEDDRHLWPEFFRLIKEVRPAWVLCENVAGHISMGLDSVLADLESEGYQQQVFLIPACAVGAHHRRDRIWIVAHSNTFSGSSAEQKREHERAKDGGRSGENRLAAGEKPLAHAQGEQRREARESGVGRSIGATGTSSAPIDVADSSSQRQQGQGSNERSVNSTPHKERQADRSNCGGKGFSKPGDWLPEPPVGRVANGVSGRVDRLKQLGNAVVPQVVKVIGDSIMASSLELKPKP